MGKLIRMCRHLMQPRENDKAVQPCVVLRPGPVRTSVSGHVLFRN